MGKYDNETPAERRERKRLYVAEWRKNNRAYHNAYKRERYAKSNGAVNEANKEWRRNNKDKVREYGRAYRASLKAKANS